MLKPDRILEKFFIPPMRSNRFDYRRYVHDLESGNFRDKFNLGVCESEGGKWLLQDFVESPNALFVGAMGSGKSVSCRFSILTWLLGNSDKTIMFIVDTLKGANDYSMFFPLSQVYDVVNSVDGVFRVIEMAYDEMMARNTLFREKDVPNIREYEKKTGKKMSRIIMLFEEFHNIPNITLNFEKDFKSEGTYAQKFHTIMRVGRAMGVWVIACTQKSTSSDIPTQMVSNFLNKNIFKVSRGEANYVLGNDRAAMIRSSQKGRCFTEYGEVQVPFLDEPSIKALLRLYVKPNDGECAHLNSQMIEDILAGEVYKHKKLSELVKNFEKSDTNVVITRLNQMMGNQVESLSANKYDISHLVTWKGSKQRFAIMIKTDTKKIQLKHINNLIQGISQYHCTGGILYTSLENIPANVIKFARDNYIEIVDKEDLIKLTEEIEKNRDNKDFNVKPDELADPTKENGEYQARKGIPDYFGEEEDDLEDIKQIFESTKNKGYGDDDFIDSLDLDASFPVENDKNPPKKEEEINKFVDSLDIDQIIEDGVTDYKTKNDDNSLDVKNPIFTPPKSGTELIGLKKQKRPSLNITFKLLPEEYPSLMVHCLRTESGEVYRVLFYVLLKDVIKHKYYLDRKIDSSFAFVEKKKLGLREDKDWNSDSLVLANHEFEDLITRYLENFNPCENPIYVTCWSKDEDFVKELMIPRSKHLASPPTIFETLISNVIGVKQTREELVESLKLRVDESDLFEEIERDYQIWNQII